ncbi:MAG TPA: ABC transporter ATP-binding protein [Ferruginibacter sp.]|nr:ABC transporter ATP-binding protein [Ferruginibacter sp.]
MNTSNVQEIVDYLKHQDYSLAVRRTLDTCLDTGDEEIIKESVQWSRTYSTRKEEKQLPPHFTERATEILSRAAAMQSTAIAEKKPLLKAGNISKNYKRGNFSLKPISLSLRTGDVLGVVGENGNGKTTLLRCLAGQLSIDAGEVKYQLLNNPGYYEIKNHIAFIPQRIPRWYGLLKDNLHFSASIAGVYGAQNDLMVDFMLERLGLTTYAHLTWNQISSGYRTRFEIARILLQKPKLLILDEPLANLDINAQQTILSDLIFMAKGLHNPMGIILSSQQLHEVEKVADTVIFIKQGNCVYSSNDREKTITSNAVEFETTAERDMVQQLLGRDKAGIQYNGGFYTAVSSAYTAQEMIAILVQAGIPLTYFRDITYSTKRFF